MQGTEAHVIAVGQGTCMQDEEIDMLTYDDATMLLLVIKGGVVFAYDMALDAPGTHEQLAWTFPLPEGPPVQAMRSSLDRQILAVQRHPSQLYLTELHTGVKTVLSSYKGRNRILGFFFSEEPSADVVLITRAGIELCQMRSRLSGEGRLGQGVTVVDQIKITVNWYLYSHETRCLMVGTGPPTGSYIQAWQFVSSGLVALPAFIVGARPMEPVAPNLRLGAAVSEQLLPTPLPPAPMVLPPGLLTTFGVGSTGSVPPGLTTQYGSGGSQNSVRLLKMYGRVYCAHINTAASRLELYRFYTDTVTLQHSYPIFSKHVELSTVDNVLVAHHIDPAVTLIFDVCANTSEPISLPLPVGLFQPGSPTREAPPKGPVPSSTGGCTAMQGSEAEEWAGSAVTAADGPGSGPNNRDPPSHHEREILSGDRIANWTYYPSNVALSQAGKTAYRFHLDLRSIVESSTGDVALLAGFLQRRRAVPSHIPGMRSPKQLLLSVIKTSLQERRTPMHVVRAMLNNLSRGWSDIYLATGPQSRAAASAAAATSLSPSEVASEVFQWLHEEELVDIPFLSAALSEFAASADAAGLPPLPHLQALSTELLLLQSQPDQASQTTYLALPDPATAELANAMLAAGGPAKGGYSGSSGSSSAGKGVKHKVYEGPDQTTSTAALVAMACLSEVADKLEQGSSLASTSAAADTLRNKVAVLAASCPPTAPANSIGKAPAELYIRTLLSKGCVLKAVRLARRLGVIGLSVPTVPGNSSEATGSSSTAGGLGQGAPGPSGIASKPVLPNEFLSAAAKTGDLGVFAAVYRLFRVPLASTYPDLEIAKQQLGFREGRAGAA